MTKNNNPPLVVVLLATFIGVSLSRWVSGMDVAYLVGVLAVVLFCRYVYDRVRAWQRNKVWYERIDSRLTSLYYRYRARVLSRLGCIGR